MSPALNCSRQSDHNPNKAGRRNHKDESMPSLQPCNDWCLDALFGGADVDLTMQECNSFLNSPVIDGEVNTTKTQQCERSREAVTPGACSGGNSYSPPPLSDGEFEQLLRDVCALTAPAAVDASQGGTVHYPPDRQNHSVNESLCVDEGKMPALDEATVDVQIAGCRTLKKLAARIRRSQKLGAFM